MVIDAIKNGIVIDHIAAGKAMELYQILGLGELDCTVAILKNVVSGKLGKKDIIKIDQNLDLDWDLIGYVDPNITVNIIMDGVRVESRSCPRCSSSGRGGCTAACTARPRRENSGPPSENFSSISA